MNIAVIGTGCVGVSTSVSFAKWGHDVVGVDVDEHKIKLLEAGTPPFYEEGLEDELQMLRKNGKLSFTTSLEEAVAGSEILYVTVGTPSDADGVADLSYVRAVTRQIGTVMNAYRLVVVKSTVPVGTTDEVRRIIRAELENRGVNFSFDVASNPEFLREGRALEDALSPERIVIGCESPKAIRMLRQIYEGVSSPVLCTTIRNAEMIKYASNAFLATKISFVNELARLCERTGADIADVARGMGMDSRIGFKFLNAGIGYGGSCFPKDVKALIRLGGEHGISMQLLQKVQEVNQTQVTWFMGKVKNRLHDLAGKRIAILGLTFKPNTDDIREAPALRVIPLLLERQAVISAYDPKGTIHTKPIFTDIDYADSPYEAVRGADAILLLTEWPEILEMDWRQVKQLASGPFLFDARNALDPQQMHALGFQYMGIGRHAAFDGR
jgi:UDPglucose 6-dehydrogenase